MTLDALIDRLPLGNPSHEQAVGTCEALQAVLKVVYRLLSKGNIDHALRYSGAVMGDDLINQMELDDDEPSGRGRRCRSPIVEDSITEHCQKGTRESTACRRQP